LQTVQITGDSEQLCQVVSNLVNNAIAYNREGGQVRLYLAAEENNATLSVSDTGIGIGEDDLPSIFERFYRVDQVRTANSGGIGLGLAICREIIRSHGGIIDVASMVGEGTTFTVQLPLRSPGSKQV
jgi:signal transduction histidine kinase